MKNLTNSELKVVAGESKYLCKGKAAGKILIRQTIEIFDEN